MVFHLNKLEFISPIVALCQVEICPKFLDIEDFSNLVNAFSLLHNYLPLEKGLAFHWTNLNPLHPVMLCAKFGWNCASGFGEHEYVKSLQQGWQQHQELATE